MGRGPGRPPRGSPRSGSRRSLPLGSALRAHPALGAAPRRRLLQAGPAGSRRGSGRAPRGPGGRCGPGSLQEALPLLRMPFFPTQWALCFARSILGSTPGRVTPGPCQHHRALFPPITCVAAKPPQASRGSSGGSHGGSLRLPWTRGSPSPFPVGHWPSGRKDWREEGTARFL